VLLDLAMPRSNGLSLLATLHQRHDTTPVIVLTALTDQGVWVRALDTGAVDVVAKPFSVSELMARVNRHVGAGTTSVGEDRFITVGRFRLDVDRRRAWVDRRDISLTEREFTLLAHLMRREGSVCRREELLHDVWGLDFDPGSNVVEACVRRVRGKLAPETPIETIRHVGYCFSL
jgi:DNA-binding response OmpR family regulator